LETIKVDTFLKLKIVHLMKREETEHDAITYIILTF